MRANLLDFSLLFAISFTLLIFASLALAISIGTAPGVMEIGEVKRGETIPVTFYLLTTADKDILVTMSHIDVHLTFYSRNRTGRYTFDPNQASDEDTSTWIEFTKNPVIVSPHSTYVVYLPNGEVVRANQKVTFLLHVPKDADPGYHAFSINLAPTFYGTGMISTIGVTRPVFIFKVPGKAIRSGRVEGIAADRQPNGMVRIDVLFRNTGTVTLKARVKKLDIYDEKGNYMTSLFTAYKRVPPGKASVFSVYWDNKEREEKKHRMVVTMDFITGEAVAEDIVRVPPYVVTAAVVKEKREIPLWLIILLIGIAMLLVYWKYW